jgi:DNA-binding Lrp family transcriptional regulator
MKEIEIKLDHWSHSQDQDYRRCPYRWYCRSILKLRPKIPAAPLSLGYCIQSGLEAFYAVAPEHRSEEQLLETFKETFEKGGETLKDVAYDEYQKQMNVGLKTLECYWGDVNEDEEIPACMTEVEERYPIPGTDVDFVVRLDALYLGTIPFILENKVYSRLSVSELEMHDIQALRYYWVLRELGYPTKYIVYNVINPVNARGGFNWERSWVEPTEKEIEWAVGDLPHIIKDLQRSKKVLYRVFSPFCARSCDYYLLCLTEKHGGDMLSIIQTQFDQAARDQ